MMGHLLPAVLLVIINHGAQQNWGPMCYPPSTIHATGQPPGTHEAE